MLVLLFWGLILWQARAGHLHQLAGCTRLQGFEMMKICLAYSAWGSAVQYHHLQGTTALCAGPSLAERPQLCKSMLLHLGLFVPTWHLY